jgi:signal transduction histidine kinase
MLMAIDTYRCTHTLDAPTGQLLDLLDRALHQIQGAVSALLVEARADGHTLTPADLEDVRTLAQPKLAESGTALTWKAALGTPTGLPAAPVRQLLLNLLLNAIQAARGGGTVRVHIGTQGSELLAQIENSGEPLPPERLAHLFEPYPQTRPHEPGLGLWVCYQIAAQLGGEIEAQAEGAITRFRVRLPLLAGGQP